ncbi:metallophosphoesterase [Bacteroidota bacterium]
MSKRFMIFFLIVLGILLAIDLYSNKALNLIFEKSTLLTVIKIFNWGVLPFALIAITLSTLLVPFSKGSQSIYLVYIFTGILILFYGPKILFVIIHLIEDVINGGWWLIDKLLVDIIKLKEISNYSRFTFVTKAALAIYIALFVLFLKGIVYDRFNYRITKETIASDKITDEFNDFKIVQLSDIHIGAFYNNEDELEKAIKKVNALEPDVILFTGDLVVNLANELNDFTVLNKLNAKYGVYSILGNHDYGEYYNWKSEEDEKQNLEDLKILQKEIGFDLLLNENRIISINGDSIAIIGIENWGEPPFPQYGNLNEAKRGVENIPFKILLSHDPTHWDMEVKEKTDIDLTLSGHTHGMQFGIFTKKLKWSPIHLKYDKWGGLYSENGQHLYVNVGLGSIGYPGRVGVRPEITVITLKSK